jgi:hypothetical protein
MSKGKTLIIFLRWVETTWTMEMRPQTTRPQALRGRVAAYIPKQESTASGRAALRLRKGRRGCLQTMAKARQHRLLPRDPQTLAWIWDTAPSLVPHPLCLIVRPRFEQAVQADGIRMSTTRTLQPLRGPHRQFQASLRLRHLLEETITRNGHFRLPIRRATRLRARIPS